LLARSSDLDMARLALFASAPPKPPRTKGA